MGRKIDDEALFERLLEGDQESLRPLMERHGDSCTLYINDYVRDFDVAEDLMIEAFSRMLVRRPRLHVGGFKPYLYKTARNLVLRHLRMRGRFMGLDELGGEPEDVMRVEEEVLRDERSRALYRCMDRVNPDYREALYLVYIEGMSYDEAGAVMHRTRKQVGNLVQRGKQAMRSLLAEEGVTDEDD